MELVDDYESTWYMHIIYREDDHGLGFIEVEPILVIQAYLNTIKGTRAMGLYPLCLGLSPSTIQSMPNSYHCFHVHIQLWGAEIQEDSTWLYCVNQKL